MAGFGTALLGGVLGLSLSGCQPAAEPAVLPATTAPVAPPRVEAQALPDVKFVEITKEAGIDFVHTNGAAGEKLLPETMGSGVAFFDYDNDGDADLLLVNSSYWPNSTATSTPTQKLYRNNGKGHFEDVTVEARLNRTFFGQGVAIGDYDNDGFKDVYITALGGGHLYHNDGKGRFEDVTADAHAEGSGDWLTSAAFFDMENDGDLDLFICTYVAWTAEFDRAQSFNLKGTNNRAYGLPTAFKGTYNILLRNDEGRFRDVSEQAGIRVQSPELKDPVAKSLGVAPCDIDGDGLVDLAVANDTQQNFLFHNKGGGQFEEIGIPSGCAYDQAGSPRGGMGIDVCDFRNDGSMGLAVANFANEMVAFYVSDDPKSMQFADLASIFGLGAPSQPPLKFGLFFFDYDLDGRLDLLIADGHLESDIAQVQASETYAQPAQLYWNTGKPGRALFTLVGPDAAGPDLFKPMVGRGSAYADIDGDGDLDVIITANGGPARLFRNEGGERNNWIRLKLLGRVGNRDAIGSKVALKAGKLEANRQLFPARGYLSSVEFPLTFGLGDAQLVDEVTITWTSGKTTVLKNLRAGSEYEIDEEEGLKGSTR